jgi:multicomponent Na+:H+ antiporter subunit F
MTLQAANLAAGCVIIVGIVLVLFRAFRGPTAYDRVLAVNVIGTKTVMLVALIGFITKRPEFLDIALLYAVVNFVATIAILKFVEYRRLG